MNMKNLEPATGPRAKARALDVLVGRNIQKYRVKRKLTQRELAERLGITFQQIQKYENATNRVSAPRLYLLASALGIPLLIFFEEGWTRKISKKNIQNLTPDALDLALAYDGISNKDIKKGIKFVFKGLQA